MHCTGIATPPRSPSPRPPTAEGASSTLYHHQIKASLTSGLGYSGEDSKYLTLALERIAPGGDLASHRGKSEFSGLCALETAVNNVHRGIASSAPLPFIDINWVKALPARPPLSQQIKVPRPSTAQILAYTEKRLGENLSPNPKLMADYPALDLSYQALAEQTNNPDRTAYDETIGQLLGCLRATLAPFETSDSHGSAPIPANIRKHYAPGGTLETYLKDLHCRANTPGALQTLQSYLLRLDAYITGGRCDPAVLSQMVSLFPADAASANLACEGGCQQNMAKAIDFLQKTTSPQDRLAQPLPLLGAVEHFIARERLATRVRSGLQIHLPTALLVALGMSRDVAKTQDTGFQFGYDALKAHEVYQLAVEIPEAAHEALKTELDERYASFMTLLDHYDPESNQGLLELTAHALMPDPIPEECRCQGTEEDEEFLDSRGLNQVVKDRCVKQLETLYGSVPSSAPAFPFVDALTEAGQAQLAQSLFASPSDDRLLTLLWSLAEFPPLGHLAFCDVMERLLANGRTSSLEALGARLRQDFTEPYQQHRIDKIIEKYQAMTATPFVGQLRARVAASASQEPGQILLGDDEMEGLILRQMSLAQWQTLVARMSPNASYTLGTQAILDILHHPQADEILQLCLDNNLTIRCTEQNDAMENIAHELARQGDAASICQLARLLGRDYLNAANNDGQTPAFLAAANGHAEVIKALADAGADLKQADKKGRTPAFIATQKGHAQVIQALAAAKADLNQADEKGRTPVFIAAQKGHAEVIKALADAGADLKQANKDGVTPAIVAAANGHAEVIKALAAAGVDLNLPYKDGWTLAFIAAQEGHAEVIQALADAEADLKQANNDGVTPALVAAQKGHAEVIKALAAAGVDLNLPDKDGWTPALVAAWQGYDEVIQALAAARADLNQANNDGGAPAHAAAWQGHDKVIQALAAARADLNQADKDGRTPAHAAAWQGHDKVIQALADAGADLNQADKDGETPALAAAQKGHAEVIKALAAAGVDLNRPITPVSFALQKGDIKLLETFSEAGFDFTQYQFNQFDQLTEEVRRALYALGCRFGPTQTPFPEKTYEKELSQCVRQLSKTQGEITEEMVAEIFQKNPAINDPSIKRALYTRLATIDRLGYYPEKFLREYQTLTSIPNPVRFALLKFLRAQVAPMQSVRAENKIAALELALTQTAEAQVEALRPRSLRSRLA